MKLIFFSLLLFASIQIALCQTNPTIIGGYMECNASQYTVNLPFETTHDLRAFFWTYKDQIDLFPKSLTVNFYTKKDKKLVFTYKLRRVYVFENDVKNFPIVCNSKGQKPVHNIQYSDHFNIPENLKNEDLILVAEPVCCRDISDNFKIPNSNNVLLLNLSPYNLLSFKKTSISITPTIASAASMEVCAGQNFSFRNYAWQLQNSNITSEKYEFSKPISKESQNEYDFVDYEKDFSATNLTNNLDSKLTINSNGFISGKENKPGKYTYVIKVTGYQDTLKICEIFNEFQLIVKDCPQQTTPSIFTSQINKPLKNSPLTICQDSLMQLNAKNYTKNGIFQWLINGSPIGGATDSIYVIKNNEAGQYSLNISNPKVCNAEVNSNNLIINFHSLPNVSASSEISTNSLCLGGTIKLTSTTTIANGKYQWYRGNDIINNATTAIYNAIESGTYSIKITSKEGCSNFSNQLNIISNSPPIAEITSANKVICKGKDIMLLANDESGHIYDWYKDGAPLNINSKSYSTNQSGNYTVKITAINSCSTTSKPYEVLEKNIPIVSISNPNGSQLCQGSNINITAIGNNLSDFQWIKDGLKLVSETKNVLNISQEGEYSVAVTDTNGCENTSVIEKIILVNKIDVKLDSLPLLCGSNNPAISLFGTPTGGIFSGTGVNGGLFNSSLAGIGKHKITYTINGNFACLNGSAEREIIVSPIPKVTFLNPNNGKICVGEKVNILTEIQDGTVYQWFKDNLPIAGATQNTLETSAAGLYKLEVNNMHNCKANSLDYIVETYTKPIIYLDSIPNFCGVDHSPITLNFSPWGGILSGNGIVGNTFDPKIAAVGNHNITYKYSGNPSCTSGEITRKVTITLPPSLDLGANRKIFNGQSVKMIGDLGNGYDYKWSPQTDLDDPFQPNPIALPRKSTTYTLTAVGPNNCIAQDSIYIDVLNKVYAPNIFTPNGDGINDTWIVGGLESYSNATISIFNRWGELIYFEKGSNPKPFDGYYKGLLLENESFTYLIDTNYNNYKIYGTFLLAR